MKKIQQCGIKNRVEDNKQNPLNTSSTHLKKKIKQIHRYHWLMTDNTNMEFITNVSDISSNYYRPVLLNLLFLYLLSTSVFYFTNSCSQFILNFKARFMSVS